MKRFIPWLAILIALLWISGAFRSPRYPEGKPNLTEFAKLPVISGGRVKPLDTIARNHLVIIHGRQTVKSPEGESTSAIQWLADVLFVGDRADRYPAFVITHPEVLGLFGWQQTEKKFFSFKELTPFLRQIDEQGEQAEQVGTSERSSYQTSIVNLRNALITYQRLKNSLEPERTTDFENELNSYSGVLASGAAILKAAQSNDPQARAALQPAAAFFRRFDTQAKMANFLAVPPLTTDGKEWLSTGGAMLASLALGEFPQVTQLYAQVGDAYRAQNAETFEHGAAELRGAIAVDEPRAVHRAAYEYRFNSYEPFYYSMGLYVLAFLLASASWLGATREFSRAAFWVLIIALVAHTYGLGSRMYLQERPPVTNLYSSAIFIGWGTVIIGLILERIFRDGIGAACAGIIGFLTLIIAHHLAGSGDTLEMLQAVLDTNLWLATHVVVITLGYSATFLAGMLAVLYVVRGFFTQSLSRTGARSLARVIYGIICFATLFSFVGTVLGGIWADQSWGRFWGWDPKENGALLIVLWCAVILHARWAGMIRDRGLVIMALFGNVITSFSWFGVNMLGVGLHSYGFMQKAFPWLVAFVISQLLLMAIGSAPLSRWRSFRGSTTAAA